MLPTPDGRSAGWAGWAGSVADEEEGGMFSSASATLRPVPCSVSLTPSSRSWTSKNIWRLPPDSGPDGGHRPHDGRCRPCGQVRAQPDISAREPRFRQLMRGEVKASLSGDYPRRMSSRWGLPRPRSALVGRYWVRTAKDISVTIRAWSPRTSAVDTYNGFSDRSNKMAWSLMARAPGRVRSHCASRAVSLTGS
jgi:hypothetical protein